MSIAQSLARKLACALLVAAPFAVALSGCSVETASTDESDLTSTVTFKKLAVTKSNADPGLTILKSKAQYLAFFGKPAPASIDFNKSWVLHYSTGMQSTGGFKAEIVGVKRTGSGANRRLEIATRSTSPGPTCAVTEALTNPQMTVKINKQLSPIGIDQTNEEVVTDCSEPDFCASALCAPGTVCDEATDSCVAPPYCITVKCANGYECDNTARACVPRSCDPTNPLDCPANFECRNQIQCKMAPCPVDYRCISLTP